MGDRQVKEIRRAYGFDEVAIVPGEVTINPDLVSTDFSIDGITLSTPVLASAMDAIVSPSFAVEMDKVGGLGVMNLEGVQTKYDEPDEVLSQIVDAPRDEVMGVLQKVYAAPVREDLIGTRIEEIKREGVKCLFSSLPPTLLSLSLIHI